MSEILRFCKPYFEIFLVIEVFITTYSLRHSKWQECLTCMFSSYSVNISQFIGIAESDVLSEHELNALKYVAHSYIQISNDVVGMKNHSRGKLSLLF